MRFSFFIILLLAPFFLFCSTQSLDDLDFSPVSRSDIGFVAYEIEGGDEPFSINADLQFSYASNLKLLTTAASLHHLGGGFRFLTLFRFEKDSGTLFIKGGGDPSTNFSEMLLISRRLKSKGVSHIRRVVVDDYLYGSKSCKSVLPKENGDQGYLACISPLSFNGNQVQITVTAKSPGAPLSVELDHPGGYFSIRNNAVATADGENRLVLGTQRRGSRTEIVVRGTLGVRRGQPVQVFKKVFTPTSHFVETLLSQMGEKVGIPIRRKRLSLSFMEGIKGVAYRHSGRELRDIVKDMNRYSSNFIADSLQYFMGSILEGDYRKGVSVLTAYAKDQLGEELDIVNGSGLGNGKNLIKPRFFIKLLKHMSSNPFFSIDFFASLPVMGENGTLRSADGAGALGMIRAKTGSLTSVAALSGLMRGKSGRLYLFTFTVNHFPGRSFKRMWRFRDHFMDQVWQKL